MTDAFVRRCIAGDEFALSLVGRAAFLEAFAGEISGRDILAHCEHQHAREKYAAWLSDARSAAWIAEVEPGGAPVGYLVVTTPDLPLDDIAPSDLEVKRVYLLHRFQGRGIGARLMAAEDSAHEIRGGHERDGDGAERGVIMRGHECRGTADTRAENHAEQGEGGAGGETGEGGAGGGR